MEDNNDRFEFEPDWDDIANQINDMLNSEEFGDLVKKFATCNI